ncbi:transporter substrate-binding domain-containing protein [Catenovulum sediminis]|uniref:Transporter substrate-binding domain-containing protein n=1 Tax=Catenovulum sediminis TaxID=1740262 RepID=A0ABV1RGA1_9ALTE|nr:transporter substrate-binding domain-containing protein [Catenovulum sediminis]
MKFKRILSYIGIFLLTITSNSYVMADSELVSANKQLPEIELGMYKEHIAAARKLFQNASCDEITDYYQNNNQIMMEAIIFCQALVAGGYPVKIRFTPYPLQERLLLEMKKERALAAGFAFWSNSYSKQHYYKSIALLDKYTYEKGLYTTTDNRKLLNIQTVEALKNFKAVSHRTWHLDWSEISCIGSKKLSVTSFPQMFKMVNLGRADYLITSFSNTEDLSQVHHGIKLIPVPGYKIKFPDSLHFFVSKSHPAGASLFAALQNGLKKLHNQGIIKKAYQKHGMHNQKVKNWKTIGCKPID